MLLLELRYTSHRQDQAVLALLVRRYENQTTAASKKSKAVLVTRKPSSYMPTTVYRKNGGGEPDGVQFREWSDWRIPARPWKTRDKNKKKKNTKPKSKPAVAAAE